jgi:hypothetical protein
VSHILSGRNKASLEVVQRIISAFPEVALPWLLNGTGPMLAAMPIPAPVAPSEVPTGVPAPAAADTVQAAALPTETDVHVPARPARVAASRPAYVAERASGSHTVAKAPTSTPLTGHSSYPKLQKFRASDANSKLQAPPVADSGAVSVSPDTVPPPILEATSVTKGAALPVEEASVITAAIAAASHSGPAPVVVASPQPAPGSNTIPQSSYGESAGPAVSVATAPLAPSVFTADKPIRRIIIFYRDGTFSDFQPEG